MPSPQLPEPDFIDRDPAAVTRDMVAAYEAAAGKTLYPAQPERLMVDVIAYRETLLRIAIQEAAKQNLVRFARAPMLDYLGELVRVARLPARPAQCPVRVSLDAPQSASLAIPAGAGLRAKDGRAFALLEAVSVPAGALTASGVAVAAVEGPAGNGFLPGEIIGPDGSLWPGCVAGAINTGTSSGGADIEDDPRLRQRILLGPEGFAVAGPLGAYQALALGAHQDIVDAGVWSAWPGLVVVAPLTASGQPSRSLLDLVARALDSPAARPLCDQVAVVAPRRVPFEIEARITLCAWADQAQTLLSVRSALESYAAGLRLRLGREIIPSKLITLIGETDGVYAVELAAPAARALKPNEYADCTGITLVFAGYGNAD